MPEIDISIFTDGSTPGVGFAEIRGAFETEWRQSYSHLRQIAFSEPTNLKRSAASSLPSSLSQIASVRNPDLYFYAEGLDVELGGVEVSNHSPDGSNIEKRYPFLWAARKEGVNAFLATPYQKQRSSGSLNCFPNRHAQLCRSNLSEWDSDNVRDSSLQAYAPIEQIQSRRCFPGKPVGDRLVSWSDIGEYFAHTLALHALPNTQDAEARLTGFKEDLADLMEACIETTTYRSPTSLHKTTQKWIQVYNTRPDTGHWERGEGQFDSIDGRLMVTLDHISHLPDSQQPDVFEFWLPQISTHHPWVEEQRARGYESKRFKNVTQTLSPYVNVKFTEDLSSKDWKTIQSNPSLALERLDWDPGIFFVEKLTSGRDIPEVASKSLRNPSDETVNRIAEILEENNIAFSTHRPYGTDWQSNLQHSARRLPSEVRLLVPRIPSSMLGFLTVDCHLTPADQCEKEELMALRQLHRTSDSDQRGGPHL